MAEHSSIEWTDATWNPVTGCAIVSPGCIHCYAMKLAGTRLKQHPSRAGLTVDSKAGPVWNGQVRLNEGWLDQPLRWKRPRRIFVCAHGDLFAEGVPDEWIDRVFAVMALAPQHTFQVLTKRAARMRDYVAGSDCDGARRLNVAYAAGRLMEHGDEAHDTVANAPWPLPNVWLGVSAERQQEADERIPDLLATPAAIRFVSAEPLLGPIDFRQWIHDYGCGCGWGGQPLEYCNSCGWRGRADGEIGEAVCPECKEGLSDYNACPECEGHDGDGMSFGPNSRFLHWIIVGGESGDGARPMHAAWVRGIREQCAAAGTAFFFKQWGCWIEIEQIADRIAAAATAGEAWIIRDGLVWNPPRPLNFDDAAWLAGFLGHEFEHQSDGTTLLRTKKSDAGRLLDGRVHDGLPRVVQS